MSIKQLAENVHLARVALQEDKDVKALSSLLTRIESELYKATEIDEKVTALTETFSAQLQKYEETIAKYNTAAANFNAAAKTINKLSERVAALEANYDPTIIE